MTSIKFAEKASGNRSRSGPRGAIAIVALVLVMAACGTQDGVSEEDVASTEEDVQVAEPAKVTLQLSWLPNTQHAGWLVAAELGFYEAAGVDIEILPGGPTASPVDAVASGVADVATADMPEVLVARSAGVPLVTIGTVYREDPLRYIAWKDSGIRGAEDLAGHDVAVTLGGNEYPFIALTEAVGLDWQSDMNVVSQDLSMDPFLTKEVDMMMGPVYHRYVLLLESGVTPDEISVFTPKDYDVETISQVLLQRSPMNSPRFFERV